MAPTSVVNLQNLATALCQNQPILLVGPPGSGKTATLREVARMAGQFDMIELYLDNQIDSGTLLGTYVCTDVPGEFQWQPGALTQALTKGLWVVIEDIDRAPFEVLSALVPLLETRKILLPGRGEVIEAAPGFRLFATYTTTNGSAEVNLYGGSGELLKNFWRKVQVKPLDGKEATFVLTNLHLEQRADIPNISINF